MKSESRHLKRGDKKMIFYKSYGTSNELRPCPQAVPEVCDLSTAG